MPISAPHPNPLGRVRRSEHLFMILSAAAIGVLGGFGAVGFRLLITAIQETIWLGPFTLDHVRDQSVWLRLAIPTAGGLVVGPLVYFFAREAKGHGVPEVMEAVALRSGFIRPRVVAVKTIASALTIASGGSVGREGPIVQIGSALGSTVGQRLKVSGRRLRTMVGCGAAAGIAATFNAPIAGALFAVEIILGDFGVSRFSPIVISSVMATVVSRHYLGDTAAFIVPQYELGTSWELLIYLVLGVACALVALAFVRALYATEDLFDRIPLKPWFLAPLGGLIVGAIGISHPQVLSVGYETIDAALGGELGLATLATLLLLKVIATSVTVGSGGSGGIFAPSLFLGAMAGGFVGTAAHALFPTISTTPGAYALVGMGAVVAGATHAPITAILIIFELTHDYKLIVPLMATCIISTVITSRLSRENIYSMKLIRRGVDIFAGRDLNVLKSLRVSDVMTEDFDTISPADHFGTVLERATNAPSANLYVVDGDGNLRGTVGYGELRHGLPDAQSIRDIIVAADIARTDTPVVTRDTDLDVVTQLFGGKSREELPVVEDGRVIGVVTRGHILEAYNREVKKRDMVAGMAGGLTATSSGEVALADDHWLSEVEAPVSFEGKTLAELDVRRRFGLQVALVRRPSPHRSNEIREFVPTADSRIERHDRLVVMGSRTDVERLKAE